MKRMVPLAAGLSLLLSFPFGASAQTEPAGGASSGEVQKKKVEEKKKKTARKRAKKRTRRRRSRRGREHRYDGTKALNRFKGDPIIWSKYRLNGKQLEVDPE